MNSQAQPHTLKHRFPRFLRAIQLVSWAMTLGFIVSLAWAIYQAAAHGNPLPVWAWLGMVILLAVLIGLGVPIVVYRAVAGRAGPLDLRPSAQVAGALRQETRRVAAEGAQALRVEIDLPAGSLRVTGGAAAAMEADFTFDDAHWNMPVVAYQPDANGRGHLLVEQRATHRPALRPGRNDWIVRLGGALPTELAVKVGAGRTDLRLGGLALTRLQVDSGVGTLVLDLSGDWGRSVDVSVKAGIGDTTLRLPAGVGVRVQPTVSLGSLHPADLAWDGEAYTNALYGRSAVTLNILVQGGLGKLRLAAAG